jgi:hypothetical protein
MLPPVTSDRPLAPEDARIELAQRIVKRLAVLVALSMLTALVFGVYNCATERPAREIFFDPIPAEE